MLKVPTRSNYCANAKEELAPGSEYISYIELDEDVYARADYCINCASKIDRKGIHWKGKIPQKKEKILTRDEKALQLFKESEDCATIYLLALYLERRKQLLKRYEIKGKIAFEMPATGECFLVEKTAITHELADKIMGLFDG